MHISIDSLTVRIRSRVSSHNVWFNALSRVFVLHIAHQPMRMIARARCQGLPELHESNRDSGNIEYGSEAREQTPAAQPTLAYETLSG
jgi:hypothetical protein